MSTMSKIFLAAILAIAVIGAGVAVAADSSSTPVVGVADVSGPCDELEHATDPRCAASNTPAPPEDATPRQDDVNEDARGREAEPNEDVRGRDAEPRGRDAEPNEPRGRDAEANEDVRGACDEAEHAGDPRCGAAAPVAQRQDEPEAEDRGREPEVERHDDTHATLESGDDRGGASGPSQAGDDSRGPGPSGDDASDEDRSGHGGGGSDDDGGSDNSGHGSDD